MQEYPDGDYARGHANYYRLPTHTNLHLHGMWMYGGKFFGGFVPRSTVAPCRVQDTDVKVYSIRHYTRGDLLTAGHVNIIIMHMQAYHL